MNKSDAAHKSKLGLSELIAMGVGGIIGGGISIHSHRQTIAMLASVPITRDNWEPLDEGMVIIMREGAVVAQLRS
jgi:hypothetical protein